MMSLCNRCIWECKRGTTECDYFTPYDIAELMVEEYKKACIEREEAAKETAVEQENEVE